MPKFILIDHSIREFGGHYYEYAIHVLKAAQSKGYNTVLATNREYKKTSNETGSEQWEVHSVYKYDFWGVSRAVKKQYSLFRTLKKIYDKWKTKFIVRMRYSPLAFLWLIRQNPMEFLNNQRLDFRRLSGWLILLVPLLYLTGIARTMKGMVSSIFGPIAHGYLGRIIKSLLLFLKEIIAPIIIINRYKTQLVLWVHNFRRIKSFARSTQQLFGKVKLTDGDIVFIPTLSEVDLLGLSNYFNRSSEAERASWHVLFRRNIFTGREPGYKSQIMFLHPLRNAFLQFKKRLGREKVIFYTDTEKLTYQYNFLNTFTFHTLPIPVNKEFTQNAKTTSYPLRIIYAGDARSEKGYQFLPRVIQELWDDYVKPSKICFSLQSNFAFNKPEGQAEVVFARNQMDLLPKDKVELIKKPLDSNKYRDLVLSGDIGLLFYDKDNYYARSSGALVECLSAGIPVVVPAGSWLAEQIMGATYCYHDRLLPKLKSVDIVLGPDLKWNNSRSKKINPMVSGELSFGSESAKSFCWLHVPEKCNYLFITFRVDRTIPIGTFIRIYIDQLENGRESSITSKAFELCQAEKTGKCSTLVNIHGEARTLWIGFSNAFDEFNVTIEDVQFHFLQTSDSLGLPTGAVGLIYSREFEISHTLKEMIDHYPHYRKTAQEFSKSWVNKHSPENLVERLGSMANEVKRLGCDE